MPDSSYPTILIIRHPDYATETHTHGHINEIVFDLGASYDITRLGPSDRDALREDRAYAIACHQEYADTPLAPHLLSVIDTLEVALERLK